MSLITAMRSPTPRRTQGTPGVDPLPARARPIPTIAFGLSAALGVLLMLASTAGLFIPGLYRDPVTSAAQARGTDLVTLAVAVPALVATLVLSARGSQRAQVVWLGILGYALYTYTIFAFTVVFNVLFLVYVAALSLAVFSVVAVLPCLDAGDMRTRFAAGLPVRTIALYLLGVAALFVLAWLKDIVPAIASHTRPASLDGTTLPTNPVEVLDLSLLLPLAVLSGVWLWQHRSWGYLLAGILVALMVLLGASIVSGTLLEHVVDATVSVAPVPLFAVVTLAGLWLLVVYLRRLRQGAQRAAGTRAQTTARRPAAHDGASLHEMDGRLEPVNDFR